MLSDIDLAPSQWRRDSEITLVDIEARSGWNYVDGVVIKHNEVIEKNRDELTFNYSSLASLVNDISRSANGTSRSHLRVNPERLWDDVHHTAKWGAIEDSMGMARIAACDQDGKVRDWFVAAAKSIDCEVRIDAIGNIFAILPGHDYSHPISPSSPTSAIAPIGIGSHLDTQPAGGRFDGILGCLAALEVLRTVKESGYRHYAPLAAICWTNEEGAGYISGCTGSSVWAGHQSLETGHSLPDSSTGTETLYDRLSTINYVGPTAAHYQQNPLTCHFELHIEQGRRLQDADCRAGIVERIQGIRWFRCDVHGQQGHAGSTPMADRADALLATAKVQVLLDDLARKHGAVGTIGVVDAGSQASSNTIAGSVSFTLDIRAPSEAIVEEIVKGIKAEMKTMEAENDKLSFHLDQVWHSPAAEFDSEMLDCLTQAARVETGPRGSMNMMSYAGHDSALTALRVPTAMLFVPCRDGISHSPEEWSTKEQCADGTQILLQAVLDYDHRLFVKREGNM